MNEKTLQELAARLMEPMLMVLNRFGISPYDVLAFNLHLREGSLIGFSVLEKSSTLYTLDFGTGTAFKNNALFQTDDDPGKR